MSNILIGLAAIVGTLLVYLFSMKLHQKVLRPFTLPVLIATICIIALLAIFHIPYDTYMIGGEWINQLLGPAVVALAYPLYQQRHILKDLMIPIFIGVLIGAITGIISGVLFAKWSGADDFVIYSLVSKSVTTPVSMAIADSIGGGMSLAAIFVMFAGIGGVLMSTLLLKVFRIHDAIGRGVSLGSASHAIGTAHALEHSELEGSVSSVAMVLSAIIVSIIAPGIIWIVM